MAFKKEEGNGVAAICDICGADFVISFNSDGFNELEEVSVYLAPNLEQGDHRLGKPRNLSLHIPHACRVCRNRIKKAVDFEIEILKDIAGKPSPQNQIEKGIPIPPLAGSMDYAIANFPVLLKLTPGESVLDEKWLSRLILGRAHYFPPDNEEVYCYEVRRAEGQGRRIWRTK